MLENISDRVVCQILFCGKDPDDGKRLTRVILISSVASSFQQRRC
jgi:hypothetical protein